MDEDQVAMLRQTVRKEMGFGSKLFGPEDPVDLFAKYLESCALDIVDEDKKTELLTDLVDELSYLKVDSNGGDRESRKTIQAIYDLLDNALEGHSLHPIDMMITGKIFSDAGWVVPDSLRQAMAEALQAAPPDTQGVARNGILSSLLDVADQAGQNPFDVYEYVNSLLAGFPPEASVMLLVELAAGKNAVIDQAVAGFVLHPDAALAQSVAAALAVSATQSPVESSLIERLVRMRPWVPQTRQAHLDATIRAMRLTALPPVKPELPKVIKCYVSVCDGSGSRSLFATRRVGAHYQLASVMMKIAGVADDGSSGTIKIRDGRDSSSNEVLRAGNGNRFSWHYSDVGACDCRHFRLWKSAAVQIGRGGGDSRPWPSSSRSCFANGNHNGPLG
jgi:hypothetical protein